VETFNRISPKHFSFGGFSILCSFVLLFSSCCFFNAQGDYSFHNKLNKDVQLFIYASGPNLSENKSYSIKSGDFAMIASLKTCDRDGFGDVIAQDVDSAKLIISSDDVIIAIWRNSGEYYLHNDYQHLPDFFHYWTWELYRLQHSGGHAEYRYFLKSAEE